MSRCLWECITRFSSLLILAASWLQAAQIPAGTNLEIRTLGPLSSATAKVGDAVQAILIAPVVVGAQRTAAPGSTLSGTITAVEPLSEEHNAALQLSFTRWTIGKTTLKVATRLNSIDNARETVDATGTIQGISARDTLTGRMDQGLGKLSTSRLAGLAQVLEAAKGLLLSNADPNIAFEAGTEMTLRLLEAVQVKEPPGPGVPPVPDDGHLAELVRNQAWQTFAAQPRRPSDITNLMFLGSMEQVADAFRDAGWVGAHALSDLSRFETARAIIEQRGYKEAPVSLILLENQPPELIFQKSNNTFSARHHLRLWLSPDTYRGQQVWLGAATHDIAIDYSQRDKTFIHKIDSDVDAERLKVTNDLLLSGKPRAFTLIPRPAVPTNFKNGTGDDVQTDGAMAVLQF